MCLITVAQNVHQEFPLILIANRDEKYDRPTVGLHFWMDHPDILAGRDLLAGGTGLGLSRKGRIAAIINHPFQNEQPVIGAHSRGQLVTGFLKGTDTRDGYLAKLAASRDKYEGYHLLFGDSSQFCQYANIHHEISQYSHGVKSFSNTNDDLSKHKVHRSEQLVSGYLEQTTVPTAVDLIEIFQDTKTAAKLVDIPPLLEPQRAAAHSAIFIKDEAFGTVATTVLLIDRNANVIMQELRYNQVGVIENTRKEFQLMVDN